MGLLSRPAEREQGGRSEREDKERRGSWIDANTVTVQCSGCCWGMNGLGGWMDEARKVRLASARRDTRQEANTGARARGEGRVGGKRDDATQRNVTADGA